MASAGWFVIINGVGGGICRTRSIPKTTSALVRLFLVEFNGQHVRPLSQKRRWQIGHDRNSFASRIGCRRQSVVGDVARRHVETKRLRSIQVNHYAIVDVVAGNEAGVQEFIGKDEIGAEVERRDLNCPGARQRQHGIRERIDHCIVLEREHTPPRQPRAVVVIVRPPGRAEIDSALVVFPNVVGQMKESANGWQRQDRQHSVAARD
jgi:hypothetical protein